MAHHRDRPEVGDRGIAHFLARLRLGLLRGRFPAGQGTRRDRLALAVDDGDLPTHYGFKVGSKLDAIAKEYERVKNLPGAEKKEPRPATRGKPSASQIAEVNKVLAALDEKGRWVEDGRLRSHGPDDPTRRIIDIRTFIRNVGVLSNYLAATREKP